MDEIAILKTEILGMLTKSIQPESLDQFLKDEKKRSILLQLRATGQLAKIVLHENFSVNSLKEILDQLEPVDEFYQDLGGVEGYFRTLIDLLHPKAKSEIFRQYHAPSFDDISEPTGDVLRSIEDGVMALPFVAEMFALGGAADRLLLKDAVSKQQLPAAKLQFAGKSLLSRLIEDIQAREYLYFLQTGKQVITPIAIMTSLEKNNHDHILQLMEENGWFGRPKQYFKIFVQPLVPVINEFGDFLMTQDCELVLKPGGHGVLWKLANQKNVFSWLKNLGKTKLLVRQINNPVAGIDYGILSFLGIGFRGNKKFGFASCPRLVRAAEGVNVLIQSETESGPKMVLTNIEYCDFAKFGIEDTPRVEGDQYSKFSSNTNLLFADIQAIVEAVEKKPYPGLLFNLKQGQYLDKKGENHVAIMGRLESTMQNIADVFSENYNDALVPQETFITYNKRHKTISTTKRAYQEGYSSTETPESCFYDLMTSARELLCDNCNFSLPERKSFLESLKSFPEIIFLYHPCLGPVFSTIAKKIQRGVFKEKSFLRLEIASVNITDLDLDGAVDVFAAAKIGHNDESGFLNFSDKVGQVTLCNVKVRNLGLDLDSSQPIWKGDYCFKEKLHIELLGNSRFIAENVTFEGNMKFSVEDGYCCHVYENNGEIITHNFSIN